MKPTKKTETKPAWGDVMADILRTMQDCSTYLRNNIASLDSEAICDRSEAIKNLADAYQKISDANS